MYLPVICIMLNMLKRNDHLFYFLLLVTKGPTTVIVLEKKTVFFIFIAVILFTLYKRHLHLFFSRWYLYCKEIVHVLLCTGRTGGGV